MSAETKSLETRFKEADAVGKRVRVFWDGEREYFYGEVKKFNPGRKKKKYLVQYDDGDKTWEPYEILDFAVDQTRREGEEPRNKRKRPRTPAGSDADDLESDASSVRHRSKSSALKKTVEKAAGTPVVMAADPPAPPENTDRSSPLGAHKDSEKQEKHAVGISDETRDVANEKEMEEVGTGKPTNGSTESTMPPKLPTPILSSAIKREGAEEPKKKKKRKLDEDHPAIGRRCKVFWNGENQFFRGKVVNADAGRNMLRVSYDDGDMEWEKLPDVIFLDDKDGPQSHTESKSNAKSSSGAGSTVGRSGGKRSPNSSPAPGASDVEDNGLLNDAVLGHMISRPKLTGDGNAPSKQNVKVETEMKVEGIKEPAVLPPPPPPEEPKAPPAAGANAASHGVRVEFYCVKQRKMFPVEKQFAEIIGFDANSGNILVALASKSRAVMRTFTLNQDTKKSPDSAEGFITRYLEEPPKQPVLLDRVMKNDSLSVAVLLQNDLVNLSPLEKLQEGDGSVYKHVLQHANTQAKTEMLKILLDSKAAVLCNEDTCLSLLQRCVENFKDHILMRFIINHIRKAGMDEQYLDEMYRYCAEHVLQLKSEEKLDKVDQIVVDVLSDTALGFRFDRIVRTGHNGSSNVGGSGGNSIAGAMGGAASGFGRGADNIRSATVLEGTPLLHAIARGNIPMAIRLMELELKPHHEHHTFSSQGQHLSISHQPEFDKEKRDKRRMSTALRPNVQLSPAHWQCKLNDNLAPISESWKLQGSPVRLVLFFYIFIKSFSGTLLFNILNALPRIGGIDLDSGMQGTGGEKIEPPLIFLCTITEKKLQLRTREGVTQLILAGANPNVIYEGATPLLACVRFRTTRLIKALIQDGNADPQLGSPLVEACKLGYQEEVEALLTAGAQLTMDAFSETKESGSIAQLFTGKLDLLKQLLQNTKSKLRKQLASRLLVDACYLKVPDLGVIDFLIASDASTEAADEHGNTAVMVCVEKGNQRLLKRIINRTKFNVHNSMNPNTGETLLVWACRTAEQPILKLLIDSAGGKESNSSDSKDSNQKPVRKDGGAHTSAESGVKPANSESKTQSVRNQRKPALSNKNRMNGLRAMCSQDTLIAACQSGNPGLVSTILNSKSDVINVNARFPPLQWTPLHLSSAMGLTKIVQILLEHGADATKEDDNNQTALCWASVAGYPDIIRLLIEKGKSKVEHTDSNGSTPLDLAIRHGNYQAAEELVRNGATLPNVQLTGKQ